MIAVTNSAEHEFDPRGNAQLAEIPEQVLLDRCAR